MAMKGEGPKFDEFAIIMLGGIIFIGILALAFSTPGEFPPEASPSEIELSLDPGSVENLQIIVGGRATNVNITAAGKVAEWLSFSETDLGIVVEETPIDVTVIVPENTPAGTHRGTIFVSGQEGITEIDVSITVSAVKRLSSRTIPVGDFTVLYYSGTDALDSKESNFVSKSYLYEKPMNLVGIVDEDRIPIISSAHLRFVVEEANNFGPIIVKQNGIEVFREVVGPGEVIVPLNSSDVARSTTVTIEADGPGLFFWAENIYNMRDIEFLVTFDGPVDKTFNFTMVPEEYTRFDNLQLSYVVESSSDNLPPMKVSLNDQIIFYDVPPQGIFNEKIERDAFGGVIRPQEKNTLTFSFEQEATYKIADAKITLFSRA